MKTKIILVAMVIFNLSNFCYGDEVVLKEEKKVSGTIICRDDRYVYIYSKEGLKKLNYKDIVLVTNSVKDRIEIPEEAKKEIEKIKAESTKRIDQASKEEAAMEQAKWVEGTKKYDTPEKRKDIYIMQEATKKIQGQE